MTISDIFYNYFLFISTFISTNVTKIGSTTIYHNDMMEYFFFIFMNPDFYLKTITFLSYHIIISSYLTCHNLSYTPFPFIVHYSLILFFLFLIFVILFYYLLFFSSKFFFNLYTIFYLLT